MRKILLISLVVVLFISFFTVSASAGDQDKFMTVTGKEQLVNIITMGTITCVNGEWMEPFGPCTEGTTRVHIKDQSVQIGYFSVSPSEAFPFFDGINTLTVDCNLDASYEGKCWGTFTWPVATNVSWEGIIQTEQNFVTGETKIDLVGTGHGGILEGMQLKYSSYTEPSDPPFTIPGDFKARIHNPKADKQ